MVRTHIEMTCACVFSYEISWWYRAFTFPCALQDSPHSHRVPSTPKQRPEISLPIVSIIIPDVKDEDTGIDDGYYSLAPFQKAVGTVPYESPIRKGFLAKNEHLGPQRIYFGIGVISHWPVDSRSAFIPFHVRAIMKT